MQKIYVNGHFLHQRVTGVQRYAREVLNGFDQSGYAYTVLGPSPFFAANRIGHHVWEQFVLPRRQEEDAVLWSPTNTGPILASNHVLTVHDASIYVCPEWFSASYVRWKKITLPKIVQRARTIITVSEYSKSIICKYLPVKSENVHVVYNGVDLDHFQPAAAESVKATLAKFGLSGSYLFVLGSLDPRKNLSRLVKAWNQCVDKEQVKGYQLVIAGGGHANFNDFDIEESPSVRMLGYVDDADLPALYTAASGFMFPSLFEGFGLPVLEAMACGTPVLTSNTTALEEIAGDAAIKVSPESIESIREGILQLIYLGDARHSFIDRGFDRVKRFSWNQTAAGIYKHLTAS